MLIFLFLLRVGAGLLNGYISQQYYNSNDSVSFHKKGIVEHDLLFENTGEYFKNIFISEHENGYSGFMGTKNSYWNDTRSNIIIKMLSLFDIVSRKNFYINILFFNFLIFFGPVALYKIFSKNSLSYKYILIACLFLLPSLIYFSSAIHRDGLIYLCLSMALYYVAKMLQSKGFSLRSFIAALFFLTGILLLRNFVFIAFVPALFAWIIAEKYPAYTLRIFLSVYISLGLLFFCTSFLPSAFNLPKYVADRQIAFVQISKGGGSAIHINPLFPSFRSFFNNIPQALNHSLMRPYITEHENFLYIPAGLEILFYEILFVFFLFFRKNKLYLPPLFYFSFFFCCTMFLIIGYTIPIIGAIVRYRSIYFPFLLIPILYNTDVKNYMKF